ncbi:MAG: hypothetical protein Q9225_000604 [Loekoesia sp. 1 TL-2023]
MFGFGESQDAHEQVYGSGGYENQAKFSHELIGGAAAFEGMKLFEDRQRKEVSLPSHIQASSPPPLLSIPISPSPSFQSMPTNPPQGKPVSHAFAKELLAGFAGAEVDKLAETKGMDEYERERAKHRARESAENMYDEHYVRGQGADEYNPDMYGPPRQFRENYGRDY